MSQQMVLVQGLTRRFGALAAVDRLDLSVRSGEIVSLRVFNAQQHASRVVRVRAQ